MYSNHALVGFPLASSSISFSSMQVVYHTTNQFAIELFQVLKLRYQAGPMLFSQFCCQWVIVRATCRNRRLLFERHTTASCEDRNVGRLSSERCLLVGDTTEFCDDRTTERRSIGGCHLIIGVNHIVVTHSCKWVKTFLLHSASSRFSHTCSSDRILPFGPACDLYGVPLLGSLGVICFQTFTDTAGYSMHQSMRLMQRG